MGTTIFDKLPRQYLSGKIHANCWGLIQAVYVFRGRKWLKIGEICALCGKIHIYEKYRKGLKNG